MSEVIAINRSEQHSQESLIEQLGSVCDGATGVPYSLFSGMPGSGKTHLLLKLLIDTVERNPQAKILLLGPTKASILMLKQKINTIIEQDNTLLNAFDHVTISRFTTWCRGDLKGLYQFVFNDEVLDIVDRVRQFNGLSEYISTHGLMREINDIKAHNIINKIDYIRYKKKASIRFTDHQYSLIWKAEQDFSFELRLQKKRLWVDLPRMLWLQMMDNKANQQLMVRQYDVILVDDVEHFTAFWLDILDCALKPPKGAMIAARSLIDYHYSDEVIRWFKQKEYRFNLGQTTEVEKYLSTNFRYQKTQIDWMNAYLSTRENGFNKAILFPYVKQEGGDDKTAYNIQIKGVEDAKLELAELINTINSLKKIALLNEILVLCTNVLMVRCLSKTIAGCCQAVNSICLVDEVNQSSIVKQPLAVKVALLSEAIGLEADHVIIMGLGDYYKTEFLDSVSLTERRLSMMEHTRNILQGVSRSKKSVSLFYITKALPNQLIPPEFKYYIK